MYATIVVDAMGGDQGPVVPVTASLEVCRQNRLIHIILVGREPEIWQALPAGGSLPRNLEIVHAPDRIEMDDSPSAIVRKKSRSSFHVGMKLVAEKKGDAFFTVGNTGAAVAVAYFISGALPGISRPALAVVFPTLSQRKVVLLDLGATMEIKADTLLHFAVLGEAFSHCITGTATPRIKLLSVGEEQTKGRPVIIEAADRIGEKLNYGGFVEGNRLFKSPDADVVVTDGFTGNVSLKVIEGLSETIYDLFRAKLAPHHYWTKVPGFLFKALFGSTFQRFDYSRYGSAMLLGINHLVGIGHGRSNVGAFKSGILTLARYVDEGIQPKLARRVAATVARTDRHR
ncbi:MAG TPA: phosphate acyltransferase PlsX [bacterium]|nr:phosphate acyltransferase PlsX [bacterium]